MEAFAKNAFITFLSRVTTAVFSILITIVVARSLGPKGQGIYSVAVLFPSLLLVFTGLGMSAGAVYFLGKGKYPPKQILGTGIVFNLLTTAITVVLGWLTIVFFGDNFFPDIEKIYLFLSLFLVPLILFFNLGCQMLLGLHKIKAYNFVSILQSGLFLFLAAALLMALGFGVTVSLLSQISSYVIAIAVLFYLLTKAIGGVDFLVNWHYLKESFVYGLKIHLSGIFDFLHSRIDLFLINFFLNPIQAGIYFISVRLAEGVWLFSVSISTVLFPKVASEKDPQRLKNFTPLVCRNVLFFSFLMIIGLYLLSGWLVAFLYSEQFSGAVLPFRLLLLGIFAMSGSHILGNDLAARGKPMLNTYAIGVSVLLNIVLNLIFIQKWGIFGAAIATLISYIVMFLVTLAFYSKVSDNKIRDIVLIKKEDFIFYKDVWSILINKVKHENLFSGRS